MDKDLIAMCDCPEIQDRWKPKKGDQYYWECQDSDGMDNLITNEGAYSIKRHGIKRVYIPRIEDVLEWLGTRLAGMKQLSSLSPVWDVFIIPHLANKGPHEILPICRAESEQHSSGIALIKALLKAYMHFERGKTWDGEAWNNA